MRSHADDFGTGLDEEPCDEIDEDDCEEPQDPEDPGDPGDPDDFSAWTSPEVSGADVEFDEGGRVSSIELVPGADLAEVHANAQDMVDSSGGEFLGYEVVSPLGCGIPGGE